MAYEFDDDDAPYVVIEKRSGSVGSFLFGIAVGAGVAILFAPRSGAETRREIRMGARRVRRVAQGAVGDATGRVVDTFQEARREVEDRIEAARNAVELKKRQVTMAMDAGRMAAQQARDDLERRIAETKAAYNAGADVARAGRSSAGGAAPGAPATSAAPLSAAVPPARVGQPPAGTGGPAPSGTPGIPEE